METEIWPNLFAACANRSMPLVIANGRLSSRSAKGYGRVEELVRQSLKAVAVIAAQTREDAQRFESIGARPERIVVTGNIKFDLDISDETVAVGRQHRDTFFGGRPALIAASTHDDEERRLLTVFGKLREKVPRLLMAVAPRHPERFAVVASLCRESGYRTVLRSERRGCGPQDDIFVLDSLGELRTFFAAADVAFIGGSLVPIGGHNLLEPAVLGLPVVFGPHVANFKEISATLVAAGGGIQVDGLESLLAALEKLFRDTAYRRTTGMRGKDFVLQNRGATERVLAILDRYLSASWSAGTGSPAI
jgi:3-deoxy-D-manno-octulosonic-acid transferase